MNTKSEKNRATPTPSAPATQVAPSTRVTPATPPIPSPLSALSDTDKKMLELLLKGASGRTIAQRLGYKEGTTRVYLHSLYKRIGVNNKTSAVTWYLDTIAANEQNIEQVNQGQPMHRFNSFGDMAVRRGLLNSLGFLGVVCRPLWSYVGSGEQVKGRTIPASHRRRPPATLAGKIALGGAGGRRFCRG
ncbi:MAG: helix-turn-helix transcriptional regulator [Betaproteobacteria bacterium]